MRSRIASRRSDVAAPMARFALASLLAVAVAGFVGVALLGRAANDDAVKRAETVARLAGHGIIEPNLSAALLRGDPAALTAIDDLVRARILRRDGVLRVKLWSARGQIVYSDQRSLIGRRFALAKDEVAALRTGRVVAALTDLSAADHSFERADRRLLEVYLPVRAATGERLLFEVYMRGSTIAMSAKRTWLAFAPALLVGLVLLALLQLPLAYRMARRLQQGRRDREELLLRAIAASETERRRIAGDLHDGVVQDLAGASYALSAAAQRVDTASPEAAHALRDAAGQTRRAIRQLRSLLVDIYPPDLHRAGLAVALGDLVAPLESRGMCAEIALPAELPLSRDVEALIFRTAQEALRNVVAHSAASHIAVSVTLASSRVALAVVDDGRGFTPDRVHTAHADGRLGLRVLSDMARDAGGRLAVHSSPGAGTRVCLEVPVG